MTTFKLYNYFRSSSSWRVRISLHYKRVAFEYVPVHLREGQQHSENHALRNKMHQVPVLELPDGRTISQSVAILEFLEEQFPDPPLLPKDPYLRSKARQYVELVNSGIQPFQNLSVQQYVKKELGRDELAWTRRFVDQGLTALEEEVRITAGAFSVGDTLSLADICLIPQLYGARRVGLDVSRYKKLAGIEARCAELDAFKNAHPDVQPDAEISHSGT